MALKMSINDLKDKWAKLKEQGQTTIEITINSKDEELIGKIKDHLDCSMSEYISVYPRLRWDIEEVKE